MATAAVNRGGDELAEHAVPPPTQLLFATHHDRYRQLLRAFLVWKRRAQTRCARRIRVAAACRVGATFCQRVFWTKWREFVAARRQTRPEVAAATRRYPLDGDEEKEKSPQKEDPSMRERVDEEEQTSAAASPWDGEDSDQDKHNAAGLLRKRRHFKRWKLMIISDVADVVRIRMLHAVRRWQGSVALRKDRAVLQQRAYFFLYYWLLKRSLTRLGRHALLKRRENSLTVKIGEASRQRLLVMVMQQWRLRLRLHETLALWRGYVQQRRHQTLRYRPITDSLTRKTHRRLLQVAFVLWEKQYAQHKAQHALVRLLDRHFYRKVCEKALKLWQVKVRQLTQVDAYHRNYQERRLRRIWIAWRTRTREKELREQHRRCAVRHHYLSLLRKGFNGLRAWHKQRQIALNRVETMQGAADVRMIMLAFSRWDHFTSDRKMQAQKSERALLHYESRLITRVWSKGFQSFFSRALTKKKKILAAQEHNYGRILRRCFCVWRGLWRAGRIRDQELSNTLREYLTRKEQVVKSRVFGNWSEFVRAKTARRVVNTQVRCQAQRRTLHKYLSQWVTYVSVLRWQQITKTRADQHYKSVIWRKCLERWRHNVALRRRYRTQTRAALVHWKLTLQRKTFDGWKQYLHIKRMKQQRVHEALEFRHEQFVREGLRHWMTAALHLQEQREQQVARTQASNTTHVWRRVAAIAQHWRYLAMRHREGRQAVERPRNTPRRVHGDMYWQPEHQQIGRTQLAAPLPGSEDTFGTAHVLLDDGNSNWTKEKSPLSEFVLLPRNRPQPRRPVEVLVRSQAETDNMRQPNENTHEILRCGFDFPVEPFAPLRSSLDNKARLSSSPQPSLSMPVRECKTCQRLPPNPPNPTTAMPSRKGGDLILPSTTARQLDVLERQLLALSHRKKEWKASLQQLETLREETEANPRLISKLQALEHHQAIRTKQWLHTKERIRSLAIEIQQLRNVLQR